MIILFNFHNYEYCYLNNSGKYHRLDGPGLKKTFGDKFWFANGFYHRGDGPAVEWSDGKKRHYLYGYHYPDQDYWKMVKYKAYI